MTKLTKWHMAGLGAVVLLTVTSCAQGQRRVRSGDLTKALASYTGDEFFALTQGLQFSNETTRERRCRGNPSCAGPGRTNVGIAEVQDSDSISAASVSPFGTIAARAVNRGNDTTAMYNMKPTGRYRYYLIVQPAGSWVLEELDVAGNTRAHRTVASGRFTPCNHPYVPGARADFRTCAQGAQAPGTQTSVFRLASFVSTAPLQGIEPPIWIACASGCCTADQ